MSILKIALSLLAVLAGIVLLCLGVIYLEKKMPVKNFDERQKQAHGRAYRISYWVGLVYYLIAMLVCVNQLGKEKTIEPYLLFLFGIMLQLTVDATYRMMTNCDLPLYQKRGWSMIGFLICGILDIAYFFVSQNLAPLSFVGYGTMPWIFLISGVYFLYLSGLHCIQYFRDRRE